ncbi:MAG: nicotinamide-nucleotide amidohydrolase family protein [Phycisphaerae bacterium]|nr:nicotinamide-nucleotide amidohydrolase family protein [Phycisphaerae bacterium]
MSISQPPTPCPPHRRAAIVSIGDELITGQVLDTNSAYLASRLVEASILPVEHITVPDDDAALAATLVRLARATDLILCSGGIGPTPDDPTREALAIALGEDLVTDEPTRAALAERCASRGRPLTPLTLLQALRPRSAAMLPNTAGTAPGLFARLRPDAPAPGADVFCLPGPPMEVHAMFNLSVAPALRPVLRGGFATRLVRIVGLGESDAAAKLGPILARDRNPLVGITASGGVLTCRIRAQTPPDATSDSVHSELDRTEASIRAALPDHVLDGPPPGADRSIAPTLEESIIHALARRAETLACAESCTGGLLSEILTRVPGCSAAMVGSWVTYSNTMKESQLGVSRTLLESHGAVSDPAARAMAVGALDRSGARHALAITGIAGPDGGTPDKPVGTVHIALASRAADPATPPIVDARRLALSGPRQEIRLRAAANALALLHFRMRGLDPGRGRLSMEAACQPTAVARA